MSNQVPTQWGRPPPVDASREEHPDWRTHRRARFASVDVTEKCPLRCAHCYFFRTRPGGGELSDDEFLRRLNKWKTRTQLDCMLWLGGEPLLRTDLLRRGAMLFRRNGTFTNGILPVPSDLPMGVMVSVDGPRREHDQLRGRGSFDRMWTSLGGPTDRLFHVTLTRPTYKSAPELVALLHRKGAAGIILGTYSPGIGEKEPWALEGDDRRSALAAVERLREEYGPFVLNSRPMLDLMEDPAAVDFSVECPYRTGEAIALDHRLRVKMPCSYGRDADCSRCGCVAIYLRAASRRGDAECRKTLTSLFRAG